jgi:hypothetical protein
MIFHKFKLIAMNRKKRDTKGRYSNSENQLPQPNEAMEIIRIQERQSQWGILLKILVMLFLLVFFSPWVFIFSRNTSISTFTGKINDFFSDSFSCERKIWDNDSKNQSGIF